MRRITICRGLSYNSLSGNDNYHLTKYASYVTLVIACRKFNYMIEIVIYTTGYCPYCTHAKNLLARKNLPYHEINIEKDDKIREEMVQKSQRKTVPQIFINSHHIGGYDDLKAFDDSGKLDALIDTLRGN